MVLVITAALLASFLYAASAVMQRRVTGQVDAKELFRSSILRSVIKKPLWLDGIALQIAGFFAQAAALHSGSLVVVAPLMTTDLIFMLIIIHYMLGNRIHRSGWLAMMAVALGIAGLLAAARPRGGHVPLEIEHWIVVFVAVGSVIITGAIIMRTVSSSLFRAAVGGITAGAHFGLTSAVTKLVLEQSHQGFIHEFAHWPLYALIIVGVSSAISMQSMYGAGSLAVSQPALEITEAVQGILIGALVFSESINTSPRALILEGASALVLGWGIIMLGKSREIRQPSLV